MTCPRLLSVAHADRLCSAPYISTARCLVEPHIPAEISRRARSAAQVSGSPASDPALIGSEIRA